MATLRNRNGKWQVQVRRLGHPPRSKSFLMKRDAERWARQVEAELDASLVARDPRVLERTTMRELLLRYRESVTANKRGRDPENKRIDGFLRQAWADMPLSRLTAQVFSRYRDERLTKVKAGTVIRDLGLLRAIMEVAMREWDVPLPENPVANVRKPKAAASRERRLQADELDRLLLASSGMRNVWLRPGILLAVETGMRRGELLNLRWNDIDFRTSTLTIREAKNGHARRIPLTSLACGLLAERQRENRPEDFVLPVSANAFRLGWERCKAAVAREHPAIKGLQFHDLRHEAVSRFFELGLSVPEVALISGHRDPRMLFRYTHLRAEDLVGKLSEMGASH